MSAAKIVADFLVAQNVGTIASKKGWAIAVGSEPVDPVECVTVYDTGGQGLDTDELDVAYPTIQVRTRSTRYLDGDAKQRQIRGLLPKAVPFIAFNEQVLDIVMTTDITSIGRDDDNRFLFTSNYRLMTQAKT